MELRGQYARRRVLSNLTFDLHVFPWNCYFLRMTAQPLRFEIDEKIECAETLASRFYTEPAMLELERERIFRRTWQLVGTLSQECGEVNGAKRTIADPESFFTVEVAGEPVVIVRDKSAILRAFSNVCRHRAGPIAQGAGCRHVFNCAYHGWTYTLDGRLIGTPEVDGVAFFDRSTMGMVPLRLATWKEFIFVNFGATAPPLTDFLGNIPDLAREFNFDGPRDLPSAAIHRSLQLEGATWTTTSTRTTSPSSTLGLRRPERLAR